METIYGKILYSKNNLYVLEKSNVRYMKFGLRSLLIQGAVNCTNWDLILLDYMQDFKKLIDKNIDQLGSFLLLGLGAGTAIHIVKKKFPKADIDVVEISEEVIEASHLFYDLQESSLITIINDDAFSWISNTHKKYDLIFIDIYNKDGVPENLMDPNFHQLINALLNPKGHVLLNVSGINQKLLQFHSLLSNYYKNFNEPVFTNNDSPSTINNFVFYANKFYCGS